MQDELSSTPKIIASTNPHHTNEATYHICMDNRMMRCNDDLDAVAKLVKVFFVFNISYDPNLRQVLGYLAHYLFNIKTETTTPQMKVLNTFITSN